MPDISMCNGVPGHHQCSDCYRRLATPSEYRQTYLVPMIVRDDKGERVCEDHWPVKQDARP